ncbi:MAG: sigma-70 family RNA polymerase sigma factor [Candidatus Dormiibacterota bacterium]
MTESEAVAAMHAGDERGFEELVRLFERRAFAVAVAMTRDPALADDVVSEAFLRAFRYRSRLDPRFGFWPWLVRVVVNEAHTAIRRRARRERLAHLLGRLPHPHEDPVEAAEENELGRWLLASIRSLPQTEMEVIHLRFMLDMDEKTIANTLGCPVGTVKVRLHRGRRRLRARALRELDGYLPDSVRLGADRHV